MPPTTHTQKSTYTQIPLQIKHSQQLTIPPIYLLYQTINQPTMASTTLATVGATTPYTGQYYLCRDCNSYIPAGLYCQHYYPTTTTTTLQQTSLVTPSSASSSRSSSSSSSPSRSGGTSYHHHHHHSSASRRHQEVVVINNTTRRHHHHHHHHHRSSRDSDRDSKRYYVHVYI